MANKLKGIFSNDSPEYESTLKFRDNDAYRNFRSALDTVENDGCVVPVDGVESISMYMQDHGVRFPIEQHTDISHFMVGPAIESAPFTVIWPDGEKTYDFKRYRINEDVVLETVKSEVVYLKLVFSKKTQKVRITYQIQYQFAKSINDITFELKACISFLTKFYTPTTEIGTSEETNRIGEIIRYLRYTAGFISRLNAVEQKLGVKFDPKKLHSLSHEDQQDIEELYLLLCRELPLRLNAKIDSTDATNIESNGIQYELFIGQKIALIFTREVAYDLLGQHFTIYTANAMINAIIKDFQKDGEKTTVYYGDTDSQPMYISYSAFLEEGQAIKEAERNLGGEKAYIEALTGIQYVKGYFDEVK